MKGIAMRGALARLCAAAATLVAFAVECAAAMPADEVRDVAKGAYVWGYPVVDMYSILRGQALDSASNEFKAPLNRVGHVRNVASPDDRVVIAPNVDTPYSYAWLDLRAEPVVVTVPPFGADRYVSLQLFDLYTWIIGYVTPRTNGREGGDFLVAREDWTGEVPRGIRKVFRSTTDLALGMFRTQLLGSADLPDVHALQDRFRVRTLSAYIGAPSPPELPIPPLRKPVDLRKQPVSVEFFEVLNWMLQFMPTLADEVSLRRSFASIGVAPALPFAPRDATMRDAVLEGERAGLAELTERAKKVRSSAELFGTRNDLKNDYAARAVGAMLGILGNAAEEYLGVGYQADADGQPFDGRKRYRIRFAPGHLPPVDAFWSITAYTPERLLYANPLHRYVINSPMLPSLARDPDGAITLYVQHDSPGRELEGNWLPVPQTGFALAFRTYLPGDAIRLGTWTAPPVEPLH
jgi:hypothetical protein